MNHSLKVERVKNVERGQMDLYHIHFEDKIRFTLSNYGLRLMKLEILNDAIENKNLILSYPNPESYLKDKYYIGAVIGPIANRIKDAKFILEGKEILLEANEGLNHLHGGTNGYHNQFWKEIERENDMDGVNLSFIPEFSDGLEVRVKFSFYDDGFDIEYFAASDEPRIFNPTNHSYFNLSGDFSQCISQHTLKLQSDCYLENDSEGIPNGNFISLFESQYDFRFPSPILKDMDQCFSLRDGQKCITLTDLQTKRRLTISTLELPGAQIFTANQFPEKLENVMGAPFLKNNSICLETQFYPNSPNCDKFETPIVRKKQDYYSRTRYVFDHI